MYRQIDTLGKETDESLTIYDRTSKLRAFFSVSVLLLFFIAYNFGITLLSVAAFGVMIAMMLLFEVLDVFAAFAFLLPNTHLIKIPGMNAALVGYWLMFSVFLYMFRSKRITFDKKLLTSIVVHVIFAAASVIVTEDTTIVTSIVRFMTFVVVMQILERTENFHYDVLVKYFVNGCLFSIFLSLAYNLIHGLDSFSGGFKSIGNDRNYFAVTVAFAICAFIIYMAREQKFTFVNMLKICVLYLAGILSASRTFIIISLISVVALILLSRKMSTTKKTILIIIFSAFVGICYVIFKDSFELVMTRFEDESLGTGNGRFDAWKTYLGETFSSVKTALFGFGNSDEYRLKLGIKYVEHNTIVQSLFSIGICGTVSLLVLLFNMYRSYSHSRKPSKKKFVTFLPLICIVVGYFSINGLYSSNLMFGIVLSYVLICPSESRNYIPPEKIPSGKKQNLLRERKKK